MGGGSNRHLVLRLLFAALLLVAEPGVVQGRRMLKKNGSWGDGIIDLWGEGGSMMREVVHWRRRLQTAPYCVASASADASKLQDALDWACGPAGSSGGGVDCSAILQTGACYSPDTLQAHASYAFNYYYVQQNGAADSCSFGGLATTTSTDPSSGSCVYPSIASGVSSPSSSNFTTPTSSGSNSTFGSPTTGSTSDARASPLSWGHICWTLLLVSLLGYQV
ncbi:hypothetical protein GOP47_0022322 [Adiantum capillus-veneris]|uniref:X8 domain-containing protein n=1 Tax=Adiantum capillus-veneris TaxID=13818 RepID=A0A9D4U5C8_ADICA|nr:hypothetical protein GOP47_0022322 [Adiantum capillus-veneris]